MSKADNLIAILLLLRSRKRMTARQLAEELEIHIRSVYRYIDALSVSGVPIVSETGRDGGYYIADHFKVEPLFFDGEEQKSLLHAARFARESGYPHEAALNRAIAKIKRYAAPEQAERLETQESYFEVVEQPAGADLSAVLGEIERATDSRTTLDVRYESGYDGVHTNRLYDPYGIVNWKGKWYVVGYCHLRGEIRHFRVDRIREVRATDGRFTRPEPFSAKASLLESLLPDTDPGRNGRLVSVTIQGQQQILDELCSH